MMLYAPTDNRIMFTRPFHELFIKHFDGPWDNEVWNRDGLELWLVSNGVFIILRKDAVETPHPGLTV